MKSMKAVRIHAFGGPEVMTVDEIPVPEPGRGQVLIKVRAASVNPVDYKIRSGDFKLDGTQPPLTLGRDVSGVVAAVGDGVIGVKAGDEVFALLDAEHGG